MVRRSSNAPRAGKHRHAPQAAPDLAGRIPGASLTPRSAVLAMGFTLEAATLLRHDNVAAHFREPAPTDPERVS